MQPFAEKRPLLYGTSLLCSALFTFASAHAEPIKDATAARTIHQQAAKERPKDAVPLQASLLAMVAPRHGDPLRIDIPNLAQDLPDIAPEPVILNPAAAERHLASLLCKPSSFKNKKPGRTQTASAKAPIVSLGISDLLAAKDRTFAAKPDKKYRPWMAKKTAPAPKPEKTFGQAGLDPLVAPAHRETPATTLPWRNEAALAKANIATEPEEDFLARLGKWISVKNPETPPVVSPLAQKKQLATSNTELAKANAILSTQPPLAATGTEYSELTTPAATKSYSDAAKLDTFPPENVLPWLCEISNTQIASSNTKENNVTVEPNAYVSPAIIIKKQRIQLPLTPDVIASATPEQLAAYAPAAGSATATDAMEPLIQLPESAAPVPTPPTVEVPAPALPAPEMPVPAAAETPALPQADPASDGGLVAEQEMAPVPEQPAVIVETAPPAGEEPPAPLGRTEQPSVLPPLVAAEEKPMKQPMVNKPVPGFSKDSQRIIKTLEPIADEKPREPQQGFVMDRAKDTSGIVEAAVKEETVTHEAEGVKIEVKTPTINTSYELEKAYNALVAGQATTASALYERVLAYNPDDVDALFGLATIYHRSGQMDKARTLYGKILTLDPENREAMNNFLALLADEAPEAALKQLEQLEKKSPEFSPIPAQMAVIYQKQGDVAKASEKMLRAVALAPENLTYRYNLAILLDKQGNYIEAQHMYEILVQAAKRGEPIPGNINKVQERLTFLRSNSH